MQQGFCCTASDQESLWYSQPWESSLLLSYNGSIDFKTVFQNRLSMSPQTKTMAGSLANLYEHDYALWLDSTCQMLNAGQLDDVDITNLLEELKTMGRSEKQALSNHLIVVLMHLLKYA